MNKIFDFLKKNTVTDETLMEDPCIQEIIKFCKTAQGIPERRLFNLYFSCSSQGVVCIAHECENNVDVLFYVNQIEIYGRSFELELAEAVNMYAFPMGTAFNWF